jgi:hypothetical protein
MHGLNFFPHVATDFFYIRFTHAFGVCGKNYLFLLNIIMCSSLACLRGGGDYLDQSTLKLLGNYQWVLVGWNEAHYKARLLMPHKFLSTACSLKF